jgi:hypothetical protein
VKAAALAPRPVPGRLAPALSGAFVVLLALPIFLLADWRIAGWALAAVLWAGSQTLSLLLSRVRLGVGSLASSGLAAFGMMFRAIAVMVVLIVVAASDARLALAAAALYALAYTLELGVGVMAYFSTPPAR